MPRYDIPLEEDIASMLDALAAASSDDEFPEVNVVVKKYRSQVQEKGNGGEIDGGKGNTPTGTEPPPRAKRDTKVEPAKSKPAVKATPLRRRKLGQSQTVDGSLLKPWGSTATSNEEGKKDIKAQRSRGPRVRVRQISTESKAEASSEDTFESAPTMPRQAGSRVGSFKTDASVSSGRGDTQREDEEKNKTKKQLKNVPVPKKPARSPTPSDESDEEQDPLDDDVQLSEEEEEVSEFISTSEPESEAYNSGSGSDSEASFAPPTRRSKSPTEKWAKPQRTLFKSPAKKEIPAHKKTQDLVIDPANRASQQAEHKDFVPQSSKTSQPKNLEDAFEKLKIFNEDSEPESFPTKGALKKPILEPSIKGGKKPILEPVTPRKTLKTLPASPLKTPKIPASPWKPEHKEFWDSEVHFGWIDQHSPDKKPESPKKKIAKVQDAVTLKAENKRKYGTSPEKRDARKAFDAAKEKLARNFLIELDERVTDGRLATLTGDTGGLQIKWSNTLLTTAGRAHWKCKTQTAVTKHADGTSSRRETKQHQASIELASKVLSNESDLLNTVAHEFCHLAVFILNGKVKSAHGPEFKSWGARCGRVFGDRGIVVTTKHNYEIEYKYIWKCSSCAGEVKRHSKSVDTERQRCGVCRGRLVQVKPTPRGGGGGAAAASSSNNTPGEGKEGSTAAPPAKRKQTAWQEFMGKEMKVISQENPKMPFKERMALVSARWAEVQKEQKTKSERREQTMKELKTAVDVLKLDDSDDADDIGSGTGL
ncbi:hypothetical protein M426DRAFT_325231 [Hypoxylon sp. CI-4A]|nr:hypothetical protein M426DRAFT_325231 [Hypoxylon sp. CI-4A]